MLAKNVQHYLTISSLLCKILEKNKSKITTNKKPLWTIKQSSINTCKDSRRLLPGSEVSFHSLGMKELALQLWATDWYLLNQKSIYMNSVSW